MSVTAVNTTPRPVDSGAQGPTLTPPPDVGIGREAPERSFNFSEFPKLEEVNISHAVCRVGRGPPWIPMALSALRPTTSPRLSSLRLVFFGSPSNLPRGFSIQDMSNDHQRIADQVTRIEREFEGAVNPTIIRDPKFEAVLNM